MIIVRTSNTRREQRKNSAQSSDTSDLCVPTPKNKHVANAKMKLEVLENTICNIGPLRDKHETTETAFLQY